MNEDFHYVLEQYNIGVVRSILNISKGMLNSVFLIYTSTGRYILKRHDLLHSYYELNSTYQLISYLQSINYSCDYFILTKQDAHYFQTNSSLFTLHLYLDGENYDSFQMLNMEQFKHATEHLAVYHKAILGFKPKIGGISPMKLPVVFTDNIYWMKRYIHQNFDLIDERHIEALVFHIDRTCEFISSRSFRELPQVVIHGDYRPANIVFQKNLVGGLFDWDLAKSAPRMIDVCGRFAVESLVNERIIEWGGFKFFLSTYRNMSIELGNELTQSEIRLIPDILRISLLQTCGLILGIYIARRGILKNDNRQKTIGLKKISDTFLLLDKLSTITI